MAVREAPKSSTRAKQFAFKYFEQVHKRVKELEHEREAQQPNRQPLIYRVESSGGSHPLQAAHALQNAAQGIDNAAQPELVAVAEGLKGIAKEIDRVADLKLDAVQNRLSFDVFHNVVASVFEQLPPLNVRQRVMAVYRVGVNFFLREERSQGPGIQGTIQSWPDQYFEEDPAIREAVESEGGMDNILGSPVD